MTQTVDVESPGRALARQQANETMLLSAAEQMMRTFLAQVREAAYAGSVRPPQVHGAWAQSVHAMLDSLPANMSDYVAQDFLDNDIPNDAYATAQVVLQTAAQTFASDGERRAAIDRAFSPDGFAVEQITAAGFWDNLQEAGSVWIKRVRRIVRQSATGLSGWTTITLLHLGDYHYKRWVTRQDDRVRHTHREANGQTVPVGDPFVVGGFRLQYPGDRAAELGETANCRCVLVGVKERS